MGETRRDSGWRGFVRVGFAALLVALAGCPFGGVESPAVCESQTEEGACLDKYFNGEGEPGEPAETAGAEVM